MTKDELTTQLTTIFREIFDDDDIVLRDDLTADDIYEWDSLNNIRLMVKIENDLNLRFNTTQITGLKNVGELINLVLEKISS